MLVLLIEGNPAKNDSECLLGEQTTDENRNEVPSIWGISQFLEVTSKNDLAMFVSILSWADPANVKVSKKLNQVSRLRSWASETQTPRKVSHQKNGSRRLMSDAHLCITAMTFQVLII